MSLLYLREIEHANFPGSVTDPADIKRVELLRAALVIRAAMTGTVAGAAPSSAVVHEITPEGRYFLERGAIGSASFVAKFS